LTAHPIVTALLDLDFSFGIAKVLIAGSVGNSHLKFPKKLVPEMPGRCLQ